jgi:hypothetical protein
MRYMIVAIFLVSFLLTGACSQSVETEEATLEESSVVSDPTAGFIIPVDSNMSSLIISKVEIDGKDEWLFPDDPIDLVGLQNQITELEEEIRETEQSIDGLTGEEKFQKEAYLLSRTISLQVLNTLVDNGCKSTITQDSSKLGFLQRLYLFDSVEHARSVISQLRQPLIDKFQPDFEMITGDDVEEPVSHPVDLPDNTFSSDSWGVSLYMDISKANMSVWELYQCSIYIRVNNIISCIEIYGQPEYNMVYKADTSDDAIMLSQLAGDLIKEKINELMDEQSAE